MSDFRKARDLAPGDRLLAENSRGRPVVLTVMQVRRRYGDVSILTEDGVESVVGGDDDLEVFS